MAMYRNYTSKYELIVLFLIPRQSNGDCFQKYFYFAEVNGK